MILNDKGPSISLYLHVTTLSAGNTVVCKPSEMTSVTAWMLCKIMKTIGLPEGVVNMVFGYGNTVGESIVTHPLVRIVSFTGSTQVGKKIAQLTAASLKKVSLELGGKNAAVVFDDADLDEAVNGVTRSEQQYKITNKKN